MAYAVIGISIPLIVAELAIPPALVDTGAFLGAGVNNKNWIFNLTI